MSKIFYKRNAVPETETIRLESQFRDSAGNVKDATLFPSVMITDAVGMVVRPSSSEGVIRTAIGRYRLDFIVPAGFTDGVWMDTWASSVDGYALVANFDFTVDSLGHVEATGITVAEPLMKVGDLPFVRWNQEEIRGINILMNLLRFRIRNTQILPDGRRCDVLSIPEMETYLVLSLSELNLTPAITNYMFSDPLIYSLFQDVIVEGAYLRALAALIPQTRGQEFVVLDNGFSVTPASVSEALSGVIGSLYSEYRARLRSLKANHRAPPLGMAAYNIGFTNPRVRALGVLKERQILP